jgi:hypothetical protein
MKKVWVGQILYTGIDENMHTISVRKSEKRENRRLRCKGETYGRWVGTVHLARDKDQSRVNVNTMMSL